VLADVGHNHSVGLTPQVFGSRLFEPGYAPTAGERPSPIEAICEGREALRLVVPPGVGITAYRMANKGGCFGVAAVDAGGLVGCKGPHTRL
jgi:hypothetical protein